MGSLRALGVLSTLGLLLAAGCAHVTVPAKPAPQESGASVVVPGAPRIVSAGEDPKNGPCVQTPHGCIALNADVTEQTLGQTICVSGYTKTVRPASSYTNGVKAKLMREAGIDESQMPAYELDHIVPLALGGHPRKPSNLMLQPWDGPQGAKMKDILEVRLQHLVCNNQVSLIDAQTCIAQNWEACATQYPGRLPH
jgi:hypothetical protein